MIVCDHQPPRIEPSKRAAVVVLVVLLHILLIWWLAMMRGASIPPPPDIPIMDIRLFATGGGGAPASRAETTEPVAGGPSAPSSLHVPEETLPWPETLVAPTEPSPPAPLIGLGGTSAPRLESPAAMTSAASDQPTGGSGGLGGGSGGGVGTGVGTGRGPGSGRDSGAVLIRGPTDAVITRDVSVASLAASGRPFAVVRCIIRRSGRYNGCRVRVEYPLDAGVGAAAVKRMEAVRFEPPRRVGRVVERSQDFAMVFDAPPDAAAPVDQN